MKKKRTKKTYLEKLIADTEPEFTITIRRVASKAAIIVETGEIVAYNHRTGWFRVLDAEVSWIDKYKPVYGDDGFVQTYIDYYKKLYGS